MKRILSIGLTLVVFSTAVHGQSPRLTTAPTRPQPGSIVRLALRGAAASADSVVAVRGSLAGEPLHFVRGDSAIFRTIGGVPVEAEGSIVARAFIERASGAVDTVTARVAIARVPPPVSQRLAVDTRFSRPLDSATAARVERENAQARDVGRKAHETPRLWTKSFLLPRSSTITSRFGTGRVFNGAVTSRHLGVDFRGAVGSPVRAANRGVVALVGDFFLAGNVVYIDHGAGVVTGYFHLSDVRVAQGDTVERGQEIGLVGATGRVTGPHLHWTSRYGALTVNPMDLTELHRRYFTNASPASARAGAQ